MQKETIGPELGIAEYLNEKYPGEEFYIVKCAVGGASLKRDFLSPSSGGYYDVENFKNEYISFIDAFFNGKPIKAGWCYNGLVDILRDSIEYLENKDLEPEIIGFCWMQGESDADTLENVENYKVFYKNLIDDFKNEFKKYTENCIFVDAGVSDIWNYYKEMNAFKKTFADANEDASYFDTLENGLTTKFEPVEEPDIYHYDCASVIKLGKLFAENIKL